MAKAVKVKVKLESSAGTGTFYLAEKKKAENRKMGSQPLFSRLGQAVLVSLSFFTSSKESPDSAEISSNESF